jgi:predicted PurR-regulated permease PerM
MKSLKRILYLIVLLSAVLVVFAFYSNNMLYKSAERICSSIDSAENNIINGNWTEANAILENLKTYWNEIQDKWVISVEHVEVDEISIMLSRLIGFVKAEELSSSLAEAAAMRELVRSVPDKDSFKLKNIL